MEYVSKQNEDEKISVSEVESDTVLQHPLYGDIHVAAGNYIATRLTGESIDERFAITPVDLELQYTPVED